MGAALARLLQRAVPALKEQQKALEQLVNQDVIREQELISLRHQKELIEQQVGTLTTELTAAQLLIEELKLDASTRKKLLMVGLGVGAAALIWLFLQKPQEVLQENAVECQPDTPDLDLRTPMVVPESLECIICMENPKEVMMEPCGHVCCCKTCAISLRASRRVVRCPVCRERAEIRTVYIS